MDFIMDYILNLGNLITVLVTAAVTWGGTFLFYKQEKKSRDIENEARQSEEWRKLYLESQEDSRKKDDKIDELRKEMGDMRRQLIHLERRVQLNSIYRCENLKCPNRECNEKLDGEQHHFRQQPFGPNSHQPHDHRGAEPHGEYINDLSPDEPTDEYLP